MNTCFLFEMPTYWELRICGYTFQYQHNASGWGRNHAYVTKEKYDTLHCKKISCNEAVLMLLEAIDKGAIFNTDSQREQWEFATAMLTK